MKTTLRRCLIVGALSVVVASLCLPSWAQDWKGKGRLQGQVVDPEGQRVQGAMVSLHYEGLEGNGPAAFATDKKGRWSYLGLASGSWTVQIQMQGFLISEGSLQVSEVGAPARPILIELKRPSVEEKQNTAADLIEQGNQQMQAGQFAEARQLYEEALADTPESNRAAVWRGIAQSHAREDNRDAALEALEKSLALDPDDSSTLKLIIDILLQAGRDEEAQQYVERLPEGEALDFPTRLNLGIDLYNQGALDGALEHFEQAIVDYPSEGLGFYYRGLVFLGQEKNAEAKADLEKFLELDPESEKAAEAAQFVEYLQDQ